MGADLPKHSPWFIHPAGLLCCTVILYCHPGSLHAADQSQYTGQGAEVALSLEKSEFTLMTSNGKQDIRLNRLRLAVYEAPYRWIQGGLQLGYADITDFADATGDEIHPSGQFAGLQLRYPQDAGASLGPHLLASYTYNHLERNADSGSTTVTLHDYHAEAGLSWRIGFVDGSIGWYFADLDGQEDHTDGTSGRSLAGEDRTGHFVSLGYWLDRSGKISLAFQEGSRDSYSLIFSRHY